MSLVALWAAMDQEISQQLNAWKSKPCPHRQIQTKQAEKAEKAQQEKKQQEQQEEDEAPFELDDFKPLPPQDVKQDVKKQETVSEAVEKIKALVAQKRLRFSHASADYWDFGAQEQRNLLLIPWREYKIKLKAMRQALKKAEDLLIQVENLRRPYRSWSRGEKEVESKEADQLEKQAAVAEKEYIKLLRALLEYRGDWPGLGGLRIKANVDGTSSDLFEEDMEMVPCDDTAIRFGVYYIQAVDVSYDEPVLERYMINCQPQDMFHQVAVLKWIDFEKLRHEPWMEPFKPAPKKNSTRKLTR